MATVLGVIALILVVLALGWLAWTYNRLIGLRNRLRAAWGDVDALLKRRADLIPNLVEAVKGYVGHEEEGRAYRYYPLVERDQAQESALRRLVQKLFSGSTELLLTHLVADKAMSEREIKRLQKLLEDRLES